ncbi:MAG: lysophospholipase [Propionibacteriaceae bacterium]|jgi:alpha-beta hydrolase superfamily lysophospholipase|nr:lysophospholipase [Propionibacteriaceae bacterium]
MKSAVHGTVPLYSEHEIESGLTQIVLSVWEPVDPVATIVFMPSTLSHPLFYESLLRGFAERGLAVVGVHPLSHGRSPRAVKRFTISDLIQNCRDAISFAQAHFTLPVITLGSCQGGIVSAVLAATDPRVVAGFSHNLVLSELPETVSITRFPRWVSHVYRPVMAIFRMIARLFPDVTLPIQYYLDPMRMSTDPALWRRVERDPLWAGRYSLTFLSSLFNTRFPVLTDGTAAAPIYVIADRGDRLFTPEYVNQVFGRLSAPHKEIVWFGFNDNMLLVNYADAVVETLADKAHEVVLGIR